MENNDSQIYCKVILLGQFGVGKTKIIKRFVDDFFEKYETISCVRAEPKIKIMNFKEYPEKSIKFEIFDKYWQEIYFFFPNYFYRKTSVVILVYDISNKDSFEEINRWYKEIVEKKEHGVFSNNFCKIYIILLFCIIN